MYEIESPQINVSLLNEKFIDLIDREMSKEAADVANPLVRNIVRQEAWCREIITPEPCDKSQLEQWPYGDQPVRYMDVEPNSIATSVQFYGTPKATPYGMKRVPVFFAKLQTDEFVKNKWELMTYRNDLRRLLAENSVKDIADQEDVYFRRECLTSVKKNEAQQRTRLNRITATGWKKAINAVFNRRLFVGRALLCRSRFNDLIDLPATAVGDSIASKHFEEGTEHREKLWGVPVVTTLKSDIVLPEEAWLFTAPNYMGKFWTLQDATLFVEQRADIIKFHVYSAIGIGFANTLGIQQIMFDEQLN